MLFSVALTSFLTGITEPIEFTFLFLAPALFAIHVVFAGLAFVTCHVLGICIGTTFSDGLIDFVLYGVLPGQGKSNWLMMIPVILVYFLLYFVVFRYFIKKWDLKTPGREDDDEEMKMMTKDEYRKVTGVGVAKGSENVDMKSVMILNGVGGTKNVTEIDCCATRLRLTLVDSSLLNEDILKQTGASGVVKKGNAIQIIYGPSVTIVKSNFEELVEQIHYGKINEEDFINVKAEQPKAMEADSKPKMKDAVLGAHMKGEMLLLTEVQDEVFAGEALGEGVAIEPSEGKLYAPADATVEGIFDTKHAVALKTDDGTEVLLHIGVDTVKLEGKFFETYVKNGQKVKKGDLLVSFDLDEIKKAGYLCTTPMIVCNTGDYKAVKPLATGTIEPGQDLLAVRG